MKTIKRKRKNVYDQAVRCRQPMQNELSSCLLTNTIITDCIQRLDTSHQRTN